MSSSAGASWWESGLSGLQSGLAAAQKQAQEAADALMKSEAAEKARSLAIQASQQAYVQQAITFAGQATEKAKVAPL
jgi:hypothetical protein